VKPKATAVSKVVSGKRAGHGAKVKVKRGTAKKKVRVDSESEDGMVRGKGGRTRGAVNWLDEEFMALLDAIEDLLPAGKKACGLVYSCFEAWAKEQGCPLRSEATVENRFKSVSASCYGLSVLRLN